MQRTQTANKHDVFGVRRCKGDSRANAKPELVEPIPVRAQVHHPEMGLYVHG